MDFVRQTMDSNVLSEIIDLPPEMRDTQVEVIVLPQRENEVKRTRRKVQFGFWKGKVPPVPDSFFEPLPEEELQAWGL